MNSTILSALGGALTGSSISMVLLLAKATGRWVADRTTASRQASASLTTALQEQLAGSRVLRRRR